MSDHNKILFPSNSLNSKIHSNLHMAQIIIMKEVKAIDYTLVVCQQSKPANTTQFLKELL
jgi:hypothetical protein